MICENLRKNYGFCSCWVVADFINVSLLFDGIECFYGFAAFLPRCFLFLRGMLKSIIVDV